ncbi:MAG: 2-phosphosulfolactate phosphatase [Ruminococcaceae bacterium]|nr:2-phosphosulfolactate phosphatase [Oscillospiraceae bacterium]
MKIHILHMIEGAKAARGLTVVIDVFRAFSVEAYFFASGAEKIIPVGNAEIAYRLKEENPDMILAGERHGKILPGFDVGNSPSELLRLDVEGKTVVHTTSAGTQGIANATGADEILGGSLVNAKAIARYIKQSGAEEVSLVCMGLEALAQTEEDNLCAEYIKSLLEGTELDMDTEIEKLRHTSGAKFFDPAQNDVFPQADFDLCTRCNCFDFVVRFHKGADGEGYMEKVIV